MGPTPEFQRRLGAIDDAIGRIESASDPALLASARQLVELVMELHGTAMERMLEMLQAGGEQGREWIAKLGRDELVSSLLVLHGLHPLCLDDRVEKAIDKIRPSLRKRGGEVELLGIEGGVLRLKLRANGHASALKEMVEGAVYQAAPDITSILIEDAAEERAGFVPLEMLRAAAGSISLNGHGPAITAEGDR